MLLLCRSIVIAAIGGAMALGLSSPSEVAAPQAKELWDQVIAAKGGRERLRAVRSFVKSEGVSFPDFSRPDVATSERVEFVCELPNRLWMFADYRPGKMGFRTEVWNKPRGLYWYSVLGNPAGTGRAGQAAQLDESLAGVIEANEYTYFLETKWVQPELVSVATRRSGLRRETAINAKWGNTELVYTIDLATHLPTALHTLRGDPNSRHPDQPILTERDLRFEDYRDIGGIQMPTRVKIGPDWGTVSFLINPEIDSKLFETPPDGVTTADAWRKWLRK
jgi:hypothetical protein